MEFGDEPEEFLIIEEAVRRAYTVFEHTQGGSVNLDEIEALTNARLLELSIKSQDESWRISRQADDERIKELIGIDYGWQDELRDLEIAKGLDTDQAVTAARSWCQHVMTDSVFELVLARDPRSIHPTNLVEEKIIQFERRICAFNEAIKLLDERSNPEYDYNQFERDLITIVYDEENGKLDGVVAKAWDNLGEKKGGNVTFDQIEALLSSRLAALVVHIEDPIFIRSEKWANANTAVEYGEDAVFTADYELETLVASQPLATREAAQSAIVWFTKTRELIRVNRIGARKVFEMNGNSSSKNVVISATRRIAASDNAVKLLKERFSIED